MDSLYSTTLVEKLLAYQTIMLYLATDDEVNCDALITELVAAGKTILVPYGEGGVYEAVQLTDIHDTTIGKRGVRIANHNKIRSDSIDCMVCPGRLFTLDGKRKGRGGGRYDRFLAKHPESHKIGICFPHQIVDDLEQRSWDVKMDEARTTNL